MTALTVHELADYLDPPLTVEQVKCLIKLMGLRPCGYRRVQGKRGRPADLYDSRAVMLAHADMIKHIKRPSCPEGKQERNE